jgi:SWI/SNF-related matrix-associated actin-dependent regulator of chromatin subfamily A3
MRWAITGTPIQNKLADFASIVKFLQVHPYSDPKTFEEEIFKPWRNHRGTDAQGFLRLKTLVRAITISRTKAVIKLPPRVDEIHHLSFTPAERERYEAAKTQSRSLLEEATSSGNQGYKTFNALWLLNILRLICNHGLLAQSALENKISQSPQGSLAVWSPGSDSFYGNILGGAVSCSNCGANLLEDIFEGSVSSGIQNELQTTASEQIVCERCRFQTSDDRMGRLRWNNLDYLPESVESPSFSTPILDSDVALTIEFMSTKIKALVADLHKHSTTEKRFSSIHTLQQFFKPLTFSSVVFSYWTTTLDLVQLMLNQNDKEIPYVRIDGKTSLAKRSEALHAFQHDDSIRVILVSITCGGAG